MAESSQIERVESDQSPTANFTFDAFISYRRSDGTKAARRLRQKLQHYDLGKRLRHLRPKKLSVFLDTVYERGADDFFERNIRPALLLSRRLIVLATPAAILQPDGKDWIHREIQEFRAHRGAANILVVRAAGDLLAQLPGDLDVTAPNIQIIDLRHDGFWSTLSPLRSSRLADEWIKLVAPLFDVPSEEMPRLRREQELAQQRVLAVACGVIAGAIAFAGALSWYAFTQQRASQKTLENSLFAASQVIEKASGLSLGEEHGAEKRSMLMTACDLFDNLADRAARVKYERAVINCDIDRVSALLDADELDRARTLLQEIELRVRARYTERRSDDWAWAVSEVLDLGIRFGLLSAKGDAEEILVVRANTLEYAELFRSHLTFSLATKYSSRVDALTSEMEKAGDFKGSAEVTETAAALIEAMARNKPEVGNESDEASTERQTFGFKKAATLRRRLGWLRSEKLKDNPGALVATAIALELVNSGLSLVKRGTEQYIALRREEMLAEEVQGTALISSRQLVEGMEADRRGLAVADALLALKINDRQRADFQRERSFLNQRIASVAAALALEKP